MKIHRLFGIVYYLLNQKESTAQILAEHFEVSIRTIYRDIAILCEAGIPLISHPGRHGGIYLIENFVLNKVLLTEAEQNRILFSLKSNSPLADLDTPLIAKLERLFKKKAQDWIEIDYSFWGTQTQDQVLFEQIKTAILNSQMVEFEYYNGQGQTSHRTVAPFQLYFRGLMWYLKAFCLLRQDYRFFKLNRMRNYKILEQSNTYEYKTESFNYTENKNIYQEVILCFSANQAARVWDEFQQGNIIQQANGTFLVKAQLPLNQNWLLGYLLSFGSEVDIIEPKHLKNTIKQQIKKMYINIQK